VVNDAPMSTAEWRVWWRREGEAGLRELLMESWDPIGVAHIPEAADEYDSYVPKVGSLLESELRPRKSPATSRGYGRKGLV